MCLADVLCIVQEFYQEAFPRLDSSEGACVLGDFTHRRRTLTPAPGITGDWTQLPETCFHIYQKPSTWSISTNSDWLCAPQTPVIRTLSSSPEGFWRFRIPECAHLLLLGNGFLVPPRHEFLCLQFRGEEKNATTPCFSFCLAVFALLSWFAIRS
jgi:hypothetical protein